MPADGGAGYLATILVRYLLSVGLRPSNSPANGRVSILDKYHPYIEGGSMSRKKWGEMIIF
jgi:hypothetical protein